MNGGRFVLCNVVTLLLIGVGAMNPDEWPRLPLLLLARAVYLYCVPAAGVLLARRLVWGRYRNYRTFDVRSLRVNTPGGVYALTVKTETSTPPPPLPWQASQRVAVFSHNRRIFYTERQRVA